MEIKERIKKRFGLADCSLDNLLWNVFWMMRCLTMNIDITSDHSASLFTYVFDLTCLLSYLYCYLFCLFYNWGWVYPVQQDSTAIIIIVSLSFASNISSMKLAYMFVLKKKLTQIIDEYRVIDQLVDPASRYGRSMLSRLKNIKKRSLVFWCSFVGCSICYLCMPLVAPGRNLPENSLHLYGLEPMFESPNYEIAYTLTLLAGITATLVPSNVTVLFIVLVGYIEAHIVALTEEFHRLWDDVVSSEDLSSTSTFSEHRAILNSALNTRVVSSREERDKILNGRVKKRLSLLVSRHGQMVFLLRRICALFEGIIACEFVLTMIALCAVLLGGLEDTFLQIPYTIIQLVVDSLVGQRLLDAGSLFEKSVYNCGWENFDVSNMKTIQVVLQCSQRPLRLTAGGVTTLCYESFMSITKSVYSAYATLSNAMN